MLGRNMITTQMEKLINKMERRKGNWSLSFATHKKGDIMNYKTYKGIALFEMSYKVLSNLQFSRLKLFGEEITREYQAGFREKRSIVD